jgi:hypothetical protein
MDNRLYVFVKGLDGHLYINSAANHQGFDGWVEVQGGAEVGSAPAAAVMDNRLYVFVKGLDGHLYINSAANHQGFDGWTQVQS